MHLNAILGHRQFQSFVNAILIELELFIVGLNAFCNIRKSRLYLVSVMFFHIRISFFFLWFFYFLHGRVYVL